MGLTWGQVHLKEEFIRLKPEHTKTNEGRLVPLGGELVEMLKAMPRGLPGVRVFTLFVNACKRAVVENFTFHDLRHTYILTVGWRGTTTSASWRPRAIKP
jgi:integrase